MHSIEARLRTRDSGWKTIQTHIFSLPGVGEPGFYRATVSYDAFRNFENTRLYNSMQKRKCYPDFHYSLKPTYEWEADEQLLFKALASFGVDAEHGIIEKLQHDSIWDFYKAIGFDWKKRRYAKNTSID